LQLPCDTDAVDIGPPFGKETTVKVIRYPQCLQHSMHHVIT